MSFSHWFSKAKLDLPAPTPALTILKSQLQCLFRIGLRKVGSTQTILVAGFSGTADTLWVAAFRRKTFDKSKDGAPSAVMPAQ